MKGMIAPRWLKPYQRLILRITPKLTGLQVPNGTPKSFHSRALLMICKCPDSQEVNRHRHEGLALLDNLNPTRIYGLKDPALVGRKGIRLHANHALLLTSSQSRAADRM